MLKEANVRLRERARDNVWPVISNDHIFYSDLSDDVHLNPAGVAKLFRSLLHSFFSSFDFPVPPLLNPNAMLSE